MDTRQALEQQLETLENRIRDCRDRMPAHSEKPSMAAELMDLEDERDAILSRLEELRRTGASR